MGDCEMSDVKYSSEEIEKDGAEYLNKFALRMKELAAEIIGDIEVKTLPHIETDAWTNYREALRTDLEHEYKYSQFKSEWAVNFRRVVFKENRDEISKLISDDILKRIKVLEDRVQEYDCYSYMPGGDKYQEIKTRLDQYVEKYGGL